MSKASLLSRYVVLAEEKARIEAQIAKARVELFEAHGYLHCVPGDVRRADFDAERRERWSAYPSIWQRDMRRTMVQVPGLGWRVVTEAWQHLWRTIPRLAHLVEDG